MIEMNLLTFGYNDYSDAKLYLTTSELSIQCLKMIGQL